MRHGLEETHGEALGRHVSERSSAQSGKRCHGSHGVAPMQDALERAGRVLTTFSGCLGAYLAVLAFGRFSAAHGTSKLGDRGEPDRRRWLRPGDAAARFRKLREGRARPTAWHLFARRPFSALAAARDDGY